MTGTADESGTVVPSSSNQLVLIPQQGDLAMGDFKAGSQPLATDYSQMSQQNVQNLASKQTLQTANNASRVGSSANATQNTTASARARAAARGITLPAVPIATPGVSSSTSVSATGTAVSQ